MPDLGFSRPVLADYSAASLLHPLFLAAYPAAILSYAVFQAVRYKQGRPRNGPKLLLLLAVVPLHLAVFLHPLLALFVVPVILLASRPRRYRLGNLFRAAVLFVLAGALYRFSTSLIGYDPGNGWSYFPSVGEILLTTGFVAFEIAAYIYLIKRFPILAGERPRTTGRPAPSAHARALPGAAGASH